MQTKEKYKASKDGHEISLQAWEVQLLRCRITIDFTSSGSN